MIKAKLTNTISVESRVQLDVPLWLAALIWRWSYSHVAAPSADAPEIHELNVALFDVLVEVVPFPIEDVPRLSSCGPNNNVDPRVFKTELAKAISA